MKKLKILLVFSYLLIIIYAILVVNFKTFKEKNINNTLKVISIKKEDDFNKIIVKNKKKYILFTKDTYEIGDILKIEGKLEIPNKNTNRYLFNYQNYLKGERIFYKINYKKITKISKDSSLKYKLKRNLIKRLETYGKKEYFYLFIYGENNLDDNLYENISIIGIAHLIALSGMHISFLILPFKKLKKKKFIIPSILIPYLIIIKPSVSIYRAALLEIIFQITNLKRKDILIFLFFIFLLYNPFFIYNLGFKLSFLTSFILTKNDLSYFKSILNTSFKALLINMPICINNFFYINLLTPIYNLFYVPYISFILFPSIILAFIFKKLEIITNIEIKILENSINYLSEFKSLIINFGYLNIYSFILLYLLIIIFLKTKRYLILIILFLIIHYNSNVLNNNLKIDILDQTFPIMIQRLNNIFQRNPLISIGI